MQDASCVVGDAWIVNNLVLEPEFAHGAGRDGKPGKEDPTTEESDADEWVLNELLSEVSLQEVSHKGGLVPRLMAVQGMWEGGKQPLYRHPLDEDPQMVHFTPLVASIRQAVVTRMRAEGFDVEERCDFNHALIQLYRSGNDCITEHADKTIDVKIGSYIVNFSLGATRTLVLRKKEKAVCVVGVDSREAIRVPLRSMSAFILGLDTNRTHLHEIKRDKRREEEKGDDEIAFGGQRLSITFRTVATFVDEADGSLSGQGAHLVDRGALLEAFRKENKTTADWATLYRH